MHRSDAHAVSYCRLCEAGCGVRVTFDEKGAPAAVEPDPEHIVTKGFFCTKGKALAELVNDPRRVRAPLFRAVGSPIGKFNETTWKHVFEGIAGDVRRIVNESGPDAVAFYHGNPTAFSWATSVACAALARRIGTSRSFTAGSIDCAERFVLADICYGHPLHVTIPDLQNSHFALLLGGNPAVSTWAQLTSIPRWREEIVALRARGGRFVVVDPRRTETADAADLHISIAPGTDADLLLGMINIIFREGLENKEFLARRAAGLDEARRAIVSYTSQRASDRCGVAEEVIKNLARDFARAPSGFAAGHSGLTMQSRGSLAEWAVILLNTACGRIDTKGGLLFNPGVVDLARLSTSMLDRRAPMPAGTPPGTRRILDDLPCAGLAPAIESGNVRALFIIAGNPLVTFPNPERLARALSKVELIVSIDPYINETSSRSHFILPPPSMLEREDCVLLNSMFLTRPYAQWTPALCPPPHRVRSEWEIAQGISSRLGGLPFSKDKISISRKLFLLKNRWIARALLAFGEKRTLETMLFLFGKVKLSKMKRLRHGVAMKSLKPGQLTKRLRTPGRRIRLFNDEIARLFEVEARRGLDLPNARFPLILISRRRRGGMNSWMNHLPSSIAIDTAPEIEISAADAERYNLTNASRARIESAQGSFVGIINISPRARAGVISATHSFRLGNESSHFNHAVSDTELDVLTGMPGFNRTFVSIVLS
ncbi:MAG: molybdopterin-dependent oxidoreductase [Planctomycetes bacterium]|nr:molybdopterin-dependent oxidoreductase [Planctomycetota bacterium]